MDPLAQSLTATLLRAITRIVALKPSQKTPTLDEPFG
jgi:hypothetical protein